jgi:hypothetical protein
MLVATYSRYISLLEENHENLIQDYRCFGQDSNRLPLEYTYTNPSVRNNGSEKSQQVLIEVYFWFKVRSVNA